MKFNENIMSQRGFANYVIDGICYNLFYHTHGNKHDSIPFKIESLEGRV